MGDIVRKIGMARLSTTLKRSIYVEVVRARHCFAHALLACTLSGVSVDEFAGESCFAA